MSLSLRNQGDTSTTQPVACAYRYTGKERDTESGLDYFGARYYGSSMGRFMSPDYSDGPDPVPFGDLENPQSLNLYSYVGNNPVNDVDEDGHLDCSGGATQDVACAVTAAAKAVWNFLSGGGSSVSTSQQDNLNVPAPAAPGVPEGAPGTATGGLIQAQNQARGMFLPAPRPGPTYCNLASCYIGRNAGSDMGPLLNGSGSPNLANTDVSTFAHSGSYHQVGRAEAQRLANMGKVVYGVYKETGHGHIITVRPNNGPYTGSGLPSTGPNDPIINDIGRNVGVYPLSQQPSPGFRNGVVFYAPNQ
jgi:RHS repeat-associated protein